jgi:hypothetical protein
MGAFILNSDPRRWKVLHPGTKTLPAAIGPHRTDVIRCPLCERIAEIERRQQRAQKADAAGGGLIEGAEWVRVTFAETPERAILDTLKAAGFHWGGGSWGGRRVQLPAVLRGNRP